MFLFLAPFLAPCLSPRLRSVVQELQVLLAVLERARANVWADEASPTNNTRAEERFMSRVFFGKAHQKRTHTMRKELKQWVEEKTH